MKRRMIIMLICLGVLFGGIFIYKVFVGFMIKRYFASQQSPVMTVSATKVAYSDWQPKLQATGSLRAIYGVNVTTDLAGIVQTIYFTPGSYVKEGTILLQLNADMEIGQLQALRAQASLAKITYERDKKQYAVKAVSKQQVDTDEYNYNNLTGQVNSQAATVAKKTIRAPFTGRLGINILSPGQYVNVGDKIVTLQTLDPLYADFYVPQQALDQLKLNQPVTVVSDTFPNKTFSGKITTINPIVETTTRNVQVEATIGNPQQELVPGMFAKVSVDAGEPQKYLTLPQAAITFNSYGDIVFVLKEKSKDDDGKPQYVANQVFVTVGETRGDQVTILEGLNEGDLVVTSGQLKLKNGTMVSINNEVMPSDSAAPVVKEKT